MNSADVGVTGAVEGWLEMGEGYLDKRFGEGFAKASPALLGAYVQACAVVAARDALTDDLINALAAIEKRIGT